MKFDIHGAYHNGSGFCQWIETEQLQISFRDGELNFLETTISNEHRLDGIRFG